MSNSELPTIRIEHLRSQWATMQPIVPEIFDVLSTRVIQFRFGGRLGHTSQLVLPSRPIHVLPAKPLADGSPFMLAMHLGHVDEVIGLLDSWGYPLEFADRREDSPRWLLSEREMGRLPKAERVAVDAVETHRCVRFLRTHDDSVAETVAALCRCYPSAKIAVATQSQELLWRFHRRLATAFPDEPLGLYTSKRKKPGRVSLGLIRQFPLGHKGEFDLLVLPYAEWTLSDEALRLATSALFPRILSFSRNRWTGDAEVDRRLRVFASTVLPREYPVPQTTAVMLESPGSDPGRMADALDAKRKLGLRGFVWVNFSR